MNLNCWELFVKRQTAILRRLNHWSDRYIETQDLQHALAALQSGGVVAHATEGVWGLSCDPENHAAVEKVLTIKGRDRDKGLIVIGGNVDTFQPELAGLTEEDRRKIAKTWPGANTWILPNVRFSSAITGNRETIACRVPGHAQAQKLAELFGRPIVSTSANRSGLPAATTETEVRTSLGSEVDCVMPGAVLNPGVPSAIHTLDGERIR